MRQASCPACGEPARVKDVSVRARSVRTGRWSNWVNISGESDDAPDDMLAPVRGTGPVWTGRSDRYQLRLSRPAKGVRNGNSTCNSATRGSSA